MFGREKEKEKIAISLLHENTSSLLFLPREEKKRIKDKNTPSCIGITFTQKIGEISLCLAMSFKLMAQSLPLDYSEGGKMEDERIKQKCVHYSTLANEEGAPCLLGNGLMTLS